MCGVLHGTRGMVSRSGEKGWIQHIILSKVSLRIKSYWGWTKSYHSRACTYNYIDLKSELPTTLLEKLHAFYDFLDTAWYS